jgi:hypothetical protein
VNLSETETVDGWSNIDKTSNVQQFTGKLELNAITDFSSNMLQFVSSVVGSNLVQLSTW